VLCEIIQFAKSYQATKEREKQKTRTNEQINAEETNYSIWAIIPVDIKEKTRKKTP
jgi:hypothetical protein